MRFIAVTRRLQYTNEGGEEMQGVRRARGVGWGAGHRVVCENVASLVTYGTRGNCEVNWERGCQETGLREAGDESSDGPPAQRAGEHVGQNERAHWVGRLALLPFAPPLRGCLHIREEPAQR